MKFWSDSLSNNGVIAPRYAFGKYNATSHVELSDNVNPHMAWADLPEGTKSLALLCCDPDVPSKGDDVNQEGRTVPASLKRVDFYHWVLVDIDPASGEIAEGAYSSGVTPRGKEGPAGPNGTRRGVNNYVEWFSGDADMSGDYFGYDGPCPPWNDEIVHHYAFTLYALDVKSCPVEGRFTGPDVVEAIKGHLLGEATITGTYHIYPKARSLRA